MKISATAKQNINIANHLTSQPLHNNLLILTSTAN